MVHLLESEEGGRRSDDRSTLPVGQFCFFNNLSMGLREPKVQIVLPDGQCKVTTEATFRARFRIPYVRDGFLPGLTLEASGYGIFNLAAYLAQGGERSRLPPAFNRYLSA